MKQGMRIRIGLNSLIKGLENQRVKEGNKRRSAEVIADNVYFGDSKPKDSGDAPAYEGEPGAGFGALPSGFTPNFGEEDGGLPF